MPQFDVFISYSRADENAARGLQAALEAQGIRCWRDRDHITPAEYEFTDRIAEGMASSRKKIAIISSNFLESYYCLQEILNALVQDSLSLRLLLLDSTLATHPLTALVASESWNWSLAPSDNIRSWIKDDRPVNANATKVFSSAADDFLSSNLGSISDSSVVNFIRYTLSPIVDRQKLLESIECDQLSKESHELRKVERQVSEADERTPTVVLNSLNSALGFAYSRLGNNELAIKYRTAVHEGRGNDFANSSPERFQAAAYLAQALIQAGHAEKALSLANQVLEDSSDALGINDPLTLSVKNIVGGILLEYGRYQQAWGIFREVVDGLKAQGVSESSDIVLSASSNLGIALMRSERELEAIEILSEVHVAYLEKLGPSHQDSAQAAIKLSECALRIGLFEAATDHAVEALQALDRLPLNHPLRAYAATVAMQCFELTENSFQNYRLHKRYVQPLLQKGGPHATEIHDFIEKNPDYIPDPAEIPEDQRETISLWLDIAWDGAVNWGDPDCMCVIACANIIPEGYYLLTEAVAERGIKLASSPQPTHWANRVVKEHPNTGAARFAASLQDNSTPLDARRKKSIKVLARIHELVPNSEYFGDPIRFGQQPPKSDA